MKPNGFDIAELIYDIVSSWNLDKRDFWFEPGNSEDLEEVTFNLGEFRSDNYKYYVKVFDLLNNLSLYWYLYSDSDSFQINITITTIDEEQFELLSQTKKYNL